MNLKKFRSALLASVAAAFMVTGAIDSAYASKHASGSSRILTEDDIFSNIENSQHAYKTPGAFTMRASKVVTTGNWTMAKTDTTVQANFGGKKKEFAKFKSIVIPAKVTDEDIEAGLKATIAPYIKKIIQLKKTAFDGVIDDLRALSSKTAFTYDDNSHNPFKLISVSIDSTDYSLFNEDMFTTKGKNVASLGFFHAFNSLGHGQALAKHVLAMIEAEVALATKPMPSTPKSTPKRTSKLSGTPTANSLLKTAQKNSQRRSSMAPVTETPGDDEGDATTQVPVPVKVTTPQPLPTDGLDDLLAGFDDLAGAPTTQPKGQTKAKGTTKPVVVTPTEEEIQKSITTLVDTQYPGLNLIFPKRKSVLILAHELLQKADNDAKKNSAALYNKLDALEENIAKIRREDLSDYTEMLKPQDLNDLARDAGRAFQADDDMQRFEADGITFVRGSNDEVLVSEGGKLYEVDTVVDALTKQRKEIQKRVEKELLDKRNVLTLDSENAKLIEANEALGDLKNQHRAAYDFAVRSVREAEKNFSTLDFDVILKAALRAEVLKK